MSETATNFDEEGPGVDSVTELLSIYLNRDKRAKKNTKIFRGQWDEVDGYENAEEAVRKLVFDAAWYSDYDIGMVGEVLRRSAYEPGQDFNPSRLTDWVREAYEVQNGEAYGQ